MVPFLVIYNKKLFFFKKDWIFFSILSLPWIVKLCFAVAADDDEVCRISPRIVEIFGEIVIGV